MGNVPISCCRSKSPRPDSDFRTGGNDHAQYSNHKKLTSKHLPDDCAPASLQQSTQNILQHISEREPDDSDTDPSSNPLNKPMFTSDSRYLQSSTSCDTEINPPYPCYSRRFYLSSNKPLVENGATTLASSTKDEGRYKASSCSTIFIDNNTISQPDIDQTIKCVSLAIYYHIRNRSSDEVSEIFDEEIHPLKMPDNPVGLTMSSQPSQAIQPDDRTEELIILDNDNQRKETSDMAVGAEPDQEHIYNFVRTLFKAAQLTSEYAITTLVYLERLMTYAEMELAPKSWRRIFLGAILLSSKVWEDQAIWNVDYAQILEGISVDDINELERHFLELIQFNMNVPSSVYAKYYFHLRTLALQNGLSEEHTLLTTAKAKELEAMSKVHLTDDWFSSPIHKKSPATIKKHTSLEKLRSSSHARAVLILSLCDTERDSNWQESAAWATLVCLAPPPPKVCRTSSSIINLIGQMRCRANIFAVSNISPIIMALLYCCILLLVALLGQLVETVKAQPSIDLDEKSYEIIANLFVTYPGRRNDLYEVHEHQSFWQKRSRVSYRTISTESGRNPVTLIPSRGTFYADELQLLQRDDESGFCAQTPIELADKLFNLNQLKKVERSFAVGPSRLLQFASSNSKNLLPPNTVPAGRQVLDIPGMDKYEYKIGNQDAYYYLFYFKDPTRNLPHGVPARLILVVGRFEASLSYEFKRIDVLQDQPLFGPTGGPVSQNSAQGRPVVFDRMAVPPLSGCDKALLRVSDTLTNPFAREFRFSFEARSGGMSVFVGYEPTIKTLRVDRVWESRSTQTLTNFHTGTLYHVLRRRAQQDNILDKLLEVRTSKRHDDDLSCIATKAATTDKTMKSGFRLGAMLFGSSELAYLGVAQVRGIEARAFLAYDSEWPIWCQQPVQYHTTTDWINASKEALTRPPVDQEKDMMLMSIIYLTYTEKAEEQLDGKLLMIEIYSLNKKTLERVERATYQIYDFAWHLRSDSPLGTSSEQFYALGDTCSSLSSEDNHYGQLDLMLQHAVPMDEKELAISEWLAQPRKRNFAIMKALQETSGLPASMLYDIQSNYRLITTTEPQTGLQRTVDVKASLRLAEHTRSLVQLIYIDRGTIKTGKEKEFVTFAAANFQSCYFVASHKKVDCLFAYDPKEMHCFMYRKPVIGNTKMSIQENLAIAPSGNLEVYRIKHVKESKMEDELSELVRSDSCLQRMAKLMLVDPTNEANKLFVELKSSEARELSEKTSTQLDEFGFSDSNKFIGFGLVSGNKHNRPIEARRLITSDRIDGESGKFSHMFSEMTFGQCQAACMADFECESFSVCVKDAHIECVLSKISFRSELLILQMLQSLDNPSKKFGAELDLILDDGVDRIKVKQHPGCELHNKLYSDFFTEGGREVKVNMIQRTLRPVARRDECAKLCLNVTLSTMRNEVEGARRASWTALNEPEANLELVGQLFTHYKSKHQNVCSSFYYLDHSILLTFSKTKRDALERRVVGRSESDITNGYCVLGSGLTDVERGTGREGNNGSVRDTQARLEAFVTRHDFDFSALFEQHPGVSMVKSEMNALELNAYNNFVLGSAKSVPKEQFEDIKLFLQRGENIVRRLLYHNAAKCARLCFLQQAPIWPSCRSFDVIEIEVKMSRETHCFINTLSLTDALKVERFDLVRDKASEQEQLELYLDSKVIRVTHYEPREHFVADSLSVASQLILEETYVEQVAPYVEHGIQLSCFGLFLTIVVALSLGLFLGVSVGLRVLIPRLRTEPEDVETLVERTTLEFNNLVNYKGQIAESDKRRTSVDQSPLESQDDVLDSNHASISNEEIG